MKVFIMLSRLLHSGHRRRTCARWMPLRNRGIAAGQPAVRSAGRSRPQAAGRPGGSRLETDKWCAAHL